MKKEFWRRHSNKTLKWRVWDVISSCFTDSYHVVCNKNGSQELKLCDEYVVQECTGCKDVKGKLIYEGDILETDEAGWIAVVVYGNGRFSLEDKDGGFSGLPNWSACRIIGNVCENPELIK